MNELRDRGGVLSSVFSFSAPLRSSCPPSSVRCLGPRLSLAGPTAARRAPAVLAHPSQMAGGARKGAQMTAAKAQAWMSWSISLHWLWINYDTCMQLPQPSSHLPNCLVNRVSWDYTKYLYFIFFCCIQIHLRQPCSTCALPLGEDELRGAVPGRPLTFDLSVTSLHMCIDIIFRFS